MRKYAARVVVVTMAAVLLAPQTADAGLLGWLSRLSGPGGFVLVNAEVCVKTFEREEKPRVKSRGEMSALRLSCADKDLTRQHLSWYVHLGTGIAWKNPLDYSGVDVADKSDNVWLLKLGTSFDYTVAPALDIGVGGGVFHFGGERFNSFSRPYLEPVRVGLRPLLMIKGRKSASTEHDGWLLLTATWVIHLGTLDGPVFGALNDPYRTYNESNVSAGVTIDIFRLLRKE